jgi:hypothetical protein
MNKVKMCIISSGDDVYVRRFFDSIFKSDVSVLKRFFEICHIYIWNNCNKLDVDSYRKSYGKMFDDIASIAWTDTNYRVQDADNSLRFIKMRYDSVQFCRPTEGDLIFITDDDAIFLNVEKFLDMLEFCSKIIHEDDIDLVRITYDYAGDGNIFKNSFNYFCDKPECNGLGPGYLIRFDDHFFEYLDSVIHLVGGGEDAYIFMRYQRKSLILCFNNLCHEERVVTGLCARYNNKMHSDSLYLYIQPMPPFVHTYTKENFAKALNKILKICIKYNYLHRIAEIPHNILFSRYTQNLPFNDHYYKFASVAIKVLDYALNFGHTLENYDDFCETNRLVNLGPAPAVFFIAYDPNRDPSHPQYKAYVPNTNLTHAQYKATCDRNIETMPPQNIDILQTNCDSEIKQITSDLSARDMYNIQVKTHGFAWDDKPTLHYDSVLFNTSIVKGLQRCMDKGKIPTVRIFSCFLHSMSEVVRNKGDINIFWTMEPPFGNVLETPRDYIPDFSLNIGFHYNNFPNYIRIPYWVDLITRLTSYKPTKDNIRSLLLASCNGNNNKFAAMVNRYDGVSENDYMRSGSYGVSRKHIVDSMSAINHVDCAGKYLKNTNALTEDCGDDLHKFLRNYAFYICPENSVSEGYVTEKIFNAMLCGCIPIYNGWSKDPEPGVINKDRILWWDKNDENQNNNTLNEVRKLWSDDKLRRSFTQDIFEDTAVDIIYHYFETLDKRVEKIFDEFLTR